MDGRDNFHPSRDRRFTRAVYGGTTGNLSVLRDLVATYRPEASPYKVYFGEIHGHSELSDGRGSPDDYFATARDEAKLDFCALTDHDHGGVRAAELWDAGKWELVQQKVAEYHEHGRFVTMLGYERDSWPYYPNACLYYREGSGEMVRGQEDGEITHTELAELLRRDDILTIPHQISQLEVGVNFRALPMELMPRLVEIYSKWGTSEYFDNPKPIRTAVRGNYWRDALERGARVGCIAGSDIHSPFPGLVRDDGDDNLRQPNPGTAAVLATELSRDAIFEALVARRCYACEGARIRMDFRLSCAFMGSEICDEGSPERCIWFEVEAPDAIENIIVIKNGRDEFAWNVGGSAAKHRGVVVDLVAERDCDYYYLRTTMVDGRRAWSSPVWVERSR